MATRPKAKNDVEHEYITVGIPYTRYGKVTLWLAVELGA